MKFVASFLFACSLGFSLNTYADGPGAACKSDVEKFCKDVEPGEGKIIHCLRQHEDSLSDECRAKGKEIKEQMQEKGKEIQAACKDDFEKYCKGIFGPFKRIQCLKNHSSEVSDVCKSNLPK